LKNISDGNLTQRIVIRNNDELGDLSKLFNIVVDRLNNNVLLIKNSADKLSRWINDISSNSVQLASSSREQSAGANEMFSTIENFASELQYIKDSISKNNDVINEIALTIKEKVNENIKSIDIGKDEIVSSFKGSLKVSDDMSIIAQKIKNVSEESENIDNILRVMKEITDQTNLLALNAAIESARAGEYGKGFSVVAGEVKNLSENSANSVKEISKLISKIKQGVNDAVVITEKGEKTSQESKKLVEKSTSQMESILGNISEISATIDEVNNIINEQKNIKEVIEHQTQTSIQIMEVINSISKTTDENIKLAENLSNFANDLKKESKELTKMVSQFKVKE
jgi:methyl-accepting chemotaxis protein